MRAFRWQDFLPIPPASEKAFVVSGLHFSRMLLKEGHYTGSIEDGYLVSIVTGAAGMFTRHTEQGFDIGQLAAGDILVTPPCHKVEWQITGAAEFTSIFITARYLAQVAGSIARSGPVMVKPLFRHKDRLMEGVFGALEEQMDAEHYDDHVYMEAMARTLCIHLLHINTAKDAQRLSIRQRTLSFEQMEKIRACIMEKLPERIPTAALAKCAHISDYHFYRVFKRTTGLTPQQFVKKCRLEQAKLLMQQTGLALSEIAFKTGFADQSHLARECRLSYGMSPRQLRAQTEYDRNLSLAF
jgi:AraC family transcriptional regulator